MKNHRPGILDDCCYYCIHYEADLPSSLCNVDKIETEPVDLCDLFVWDCGDPHELMKKFP